MRTIIIKIKWNIAKLMNKIKAIFENILEYIGFHYVGYKVYIDINAKEIKAINDRLKDMSNKYEDKLQERFYDFKHQHITPLEDVINNNDETLFNEVATLKEYIKELEKQVNEHDGLINESDINSQVDINKQHIKEIETSISSLDISQYNNDKKIKEHIESVEKLVNKLRELNQINEGNKDD